MNKTATYLYYKNLFYLKKVNKNLINHTNHKKDVIKHMMLNVIDGILMFQLYMYENIPKYLR